MAHEAKALDIQYGAVRGYSGSQVLIQYYGIGKKVNYICNILNFGCTSTKKSTLGTTATVTLKTEIKNELKDKGATHITLSKSGNWLAYYISADSPENVRTYVVKNLKTNNDYIISENISYWDLINEQKKVFEFSPDEKSLVYLDDKDNEMSLYKVELSSLTGTELVNKKLTTSAYNIGYFIYTDSQNIYYVGNNKINPYNWILYDFDLKTGKEKIIETNVSYLDSIIKINNSIVFIRLQEKGYGPEVYNTKTKKIGFFKVPNIKTSRVIKNETNIKIGDSNAVVMTPPTYNPNKSYPVMIWLHGGPLRQTSLGYHPYHSYGIYDAMLKLLQKNNVIIIKLDYSGSFGTGREYSESIKGNVGKGDIDDVMEAVKYAKDKYKVKDVYLSGNSYGGYMSLRAVVEYPETFKGVFSINGVTDWESLLVRMKTSIFNTQFYGLPNESNRKLYDQASIINRIGNLGNQRIEIIQGEADGTIPPWQATLLSDKLKEAGKNVNLVTYKGEDHVFAGKKNIGDVCVRMFKFVGIPVDKECTK